MTATRDDWGSGEGTHVGGTTHCEENSQGRDWHGRRSQHSGGTL